MADKNIKGKQQDVGGLNKADKSERHNDNARASAAVKPDNPRINTDNL